MNAQHREKIYRKCLICYHILQAKCEFHLKRRKRTDGWGRGEGNEKRKRVPFKRYKVDSKMLKIYPFLLGT